jgi:quinolinate synthase
MQTDKKTLKSDLKHEIKRLKKELNAVILAHYYQESEIQDIADFVGDSLELARKAKATSADVIVFSGVHFMAETAKILNPNKLVLLPDLDAGCSLAEGCPADDFKAFREKYPDHLAITYINCSAEVKALSDIICTSSSAEKIINQIPLNKPILFSPDRNLGRYLIKKTGREMLLWNGSSCYETFVPKIIDLKTKYPKAN